MCRCWLPDAWHPLPVPRRATPTPAQCGSRRRGTLAYASLLARYNSHSSGRFHMLHYAVVFFVIALIAALFGFSGLAAGAAGIAKILFAVFLVIALVTFIL